MNSYIKRAIQNIAIFLSALIGIKNFFAALPLKFTVRFAGVYSSIANHNVVAIHQILSFFAGLLMLLLTYRVYKRVRIAWAIFIGTVTK